MIWRAELVTPTLPSPLSVYVALIQRWANSNVAQYFRFSYQSPRYYGSGLIEFSILSRNKINQHHESKMNTLLASKFGTTFTEGQPPKKILCDWTQTRQLTTTTKNSIVEDLDMVVDKMTSRKVLTDELPAAQYLYLPLNIQNFVCLSLKFTSALVQWSRQKNVWWKITEWWIVSDKDNDS